MALTEMQRRNLSNLDLEVGTGIFTNNTRIDSTKQPTVIIGLGGLGCRTVNELKRQVMHRINIEHNTIRFLAIDSDESELRQYDALSPGEETVSLYDHTIVALAAAPTAIPLHIKEWMNSNLQPNLNGTGCGGVRQNGRISLAAAPVYDRVRRKLRDVIWSAKNAAFDVRVNIIFIAGISGGTGSGIFIDMAYLVQDVLINEFHMVNRTSFDLSAYLYMPDVFYDIPGVCRSVLDRNAYVALKELDYYMNIEKSGGVYQWPFFEGCMKNSQYRVFDFCTLVSGSDAVAGDPRQAAISSVVENVMTVVSSAEHTDGWSTVPLSSLLMEDTGHPVNVWLSNNMGLFPESANYCYSVLDFSSAKVPVDAIMSYMAHEMYKKVLAEFSDTSGINEGIILNIINSAGLGNVDSIIRAVKDVAGYTYTPPELPTGRDIRNLRGTYTQWKMRAYEHYKSFKQQQQFHTAIDAVTNNIIEALDSSLEKTFDVKGPYFAAHAITATREANNVAGVAQKLDDFRSAILTTLDERYAFVSTWQHLEARMDAGAAELGSFLFVNNDDRDAFMLNARRMLEMHTIEIDVLGCMLEKLTEIRKHIIEKSNKVFDVYTDVLEHIKGILAKNSDLVLWNMRWQSDNIFDAVDIDAMRWNGQKLKQCVDSCLTDEFVGKFKGDFVEMLSDRNNRSAFTDQRDGFDAASCVQNIFAMSLGHYYPEALERFFIVYYSIDPQMNDYNYLDYVMANLMQKNAELTNAATAICNELIRRKRQLCNIADNISLFTEPRKYLIVPQSLVPTFMNVVPMTIGPDVCVCGTERAFSFDYIVHYPGIPLYEISGMDNMDTAYSEAVENGSIGLHLNENSEDFTKLPTPFVYEMWERFGYESSVELRNLNEAKRVVDRLEELGYIVCNDEYSSWPRIEGYFAREFSEEDIRDMKYWIYKNLRMDGLCATTINKMLEEMGVETTTLNIAMSHDFILPSTYDNRYIIVRKNPVLFKKLDAFLQKVEKFVVPIVIG